jgi:hypothetical protein
MLNHIRYDLPIVLRTDASTKGIGGVLMNVDGGVELPVCFLSKAFTETESRWSTIEQEAYAVFYCVTNLPHYLLGHPFVVETDHRNLVYLAKSSVPKLVRWHLKLQEFDFTIKHISGKTNVVADALSRCHALSDDAVSKIAKAHNAVVGHRGVKQTVSMLKEAGLVWESMQKDVEDFIHSCATCQKVRLGIGNVTSALATTMVEEPFHTVAVDTVGPLPADEHGHQYVIVLIDCFSRFVELVAATDTKAVQAAKAILQVCGRYGAPKFLRTDRGPQYAAAVVQQLLELFGVEHQFTIAYRHEANGLVERANGEVMRHLRAVVFDRRMQDKWSQALPLVQRIMNSTVSASTGCSPSRIMFGDRINLNRVVLTQPDDHPTMSSVESYIEKLTEAQAAVVEASQLHQQKVVEKQADLQPKEVVSYDQGDLVLVSYPERPPNKLAPKWRGPMVVADLRSRSAIIVQDLCTNKLMEVHISRLKPFNAARTADPIKVAEIDKDEYAVEQILEHRGTSKKTLQFKVRWMGYGEEEDSWIGFKDAKDLEALDVYLKTHPELRI